MQRTNFTAEHEVSLTADCSVPASCGFARSWAVVIGINDYGNGIPALRTAAGDARRLARILADEHDYEVLLHDTEASLATLRELLGTTLPGCVGANDRVLFYFAGHGVAIDGDDGPAGYLIPQDARAGEIVLMSSGGKVIDTVMSSPDGHWLVTAIR